MTDSNPEPKIEESPEQSQHMTRQDFEQAWSAREAEWRKREEVWQTREKNFIAEANANRHEKMAFFCEELIKQGRITPAEKDFWTQTLVQLDTFECQLEFVEGETKASKPTSEFVRNHLSTLAPRVNFSELAAPSRGTIPSSLAREVEIGRQIADIRNRSFNQENKS